MARKEDFDKGKDNSPFGTGPHGGDRDLDEPNDNGWGTHVERPRMSCPHCPAMFHFSTGLSTHKNQQHPDYLW
jgi:hypothetical protein